jgi:cytochrome P450
LASPSFTPRAMKRIDAAVEQSARERVDSLAGEPEWIQSSFVVGLERLPIRYRIATGA